MRVVREKVADQKTNQGHKRHIKHRIILCLLCFWWPCSDLLYRMFYIILCDTLSTAIHTFVYRNAIVIALISRVSY
jgi:hypothetical protein